METKIILSVPPEHLQAALAQARPIAHMAYQIGPQLNLFRANIPLSLKGGLMMLGDGESDLRGGAPEVLATQVIRECIHRGFAGVVLGFTRTSPMLHATAAVLSGRLRRSGGELYLPEAYADDSDWAKILIPTAISGGSLATRLSEVMGHYGKDRICLDIERVRMDFCLPADNGAGTALTAREFYTLTRKKNPQPYFSQDLCAYYFTYQDEKGSHFVLFDDAGSIRKKLFLAARMGIHCAMLFYPEVEDILPAVFP